MILQEVEFGCSSLSQSVSSEVLDLDQSMTGYGTGMARLPFGTRESTGGILA